MQRAFNWKITQLLLMTYLYRVLTHFDETFKKFSLPIVGIIKAELEKDKK